MAEAEVARAESEAAPVNQQIANRELAAINEEVRKDGSFYLLSLQHNGVTSGHLQLTRYGASGALQATTTAFFPR